MMLVIRAYSGGLLLAPTSLLSPGHEVITQKTHLLAAPVGLLFVETFVMLCNRMYKATVGPRVESLLCLGRAFEYGFSWRRRICT
jgi:hypothetical protein